MATTKPAGQTTQRQVRRLGPVTVTTIQRDLNGDGKPDRISIELVAGRKYDDQTLWCGNGRKYEGRFDLCVEIAGKSPVRTNLNRLMFPGEKDEEPLFFRSEPWQIQFADYNHDGQIDFNLGQYAGCNGWAYRLFTISPSGAVSEIPIEDGKEITWADGSNSTDQIHLTKRGFWYAHYDQLRGGLTSTYAWDKAKKRFVLAKEGPAP